MFNWLQSLFSANKPAKPPTREAYRQGYVRGRYDAAQNTAENLPLWGLTDYLSARAANSFQVRRQLKIRSRYECDNNSYYRGMVNSLANDLVGTGPRLQMRSGDEKFDGELERLWGQWCEAVGFAQSLRTKCKSKITDGEGVALLVNNQSLAATLGGKLRVDDPVQLDFYVIESDQLTTPDPGFVDLFWVDGVVLNKMGKPKEYHVLRHHPGDLYVPQMVPLAFDKWQPRHVCHWFRCDRPGQARGIPEATPALELFAQIRRYTKAVIQAAETAADFAAVLESQGPANDDPGTDENAGLIPSTQLPIDRGLMTVLPFGYQLKQMQGTQPATTYEMFVRVILREAARVLDIPLTLALGDSSGSNFSSARMEHLPYWRTRKVVRQECEASTVEKTLRAWYEEAWLIPGYLPKGAPPTAPGHRWFWDSAESIDPQKDAAADKQELENGTETLADIYARRGEDWEAKLRQRARELKLSRELGITPAAPANPAAPAKTAARSQLQRRAVASAAKPAKLRNRIAAFDEDQPRDSDGKLSSGDGQAGRHNQEQVELDTRHETETVALDTRHESERGAVESRHEVEKAELGNRQAVEKAGVHESEHESLDEKHEAEHEELTDRHQEELDAVDDHHDTEREQHEERQQGEQESLADRHEKEAAEQEKHLDAKHEREGEGLESRHEKEQDRLEKQQERDGEKLDAGHEKESDRVTDKRDAEDEKRDTRREKEDDRLIENRDREDEKLDGQHTEELQERSDTDSQEETDKKDLLDNEADKRLDSRRKAADEAYAKQDAEIEERRAAEDKAIEEARAKEDEEREARQAKEQEELPKRHLKELNDLWDRHSQEKHALNKAQEEERRTYDHQASKKVHASLRLDLAARN